MEKEERERVNLLAQRDFLIRSYGMLEQVVPQLFILIFNSIYLDVHIILGRSNSDEYSIVGNLHIAVLGSVSHYLNLARYMHLPLDYVLDVSHAT